MTKLATECRLEAISESDGALLLKWQNEELARQFMRNKSSPRQEEHEKWFKNRLMQFPLMFWKIICSTDSNFREPAGFIRLDELARPNSYEVSVLISRKFEGQGFAKTAINKVCRKFPHSIIYACIAKDNIASIKAFSKSGFSECEVDSLKNSEDWLWYAFEKK